MRLRPCPACCRHVAIDDLACVFCDAPLEPTTPPGEPLVRLSRAAIFVAAITTAGCWTSKNEPRHVASHAHAADAGVAADANPRDPDGVGQKRLDEEERQERHYQNHPCSGQPPVCAPYGAPPARRRVV